ncbi:MAG: carboxylesterase family protein [Caulobacterales bacterium]|nr:carboxylesterase family protein [Caulobacterales bacterium]
MTASLRLSRLLFVAVAIFAGCATGTPSNINPEIRAIEPGLIEGEGDELSLHFLGIPFARPPVGERRWRAPERPSPWTGVRPAQDFGPACTQVTALVGAGAPPPQSEDCLTLNVSVPASAAEGSDLPVLVRIHGGAFGVGSGRQNHAAHIWNADGIVLVTLNYRLGPLGFFSHPALQDETGGAAQSANFALLDMVAALEWVRDNIAVFGGDPSRVTVAGSSAGGMAVQLLLSMPDAEGLFAGAIISSGYGAWPLPRTPRARTSQPPAALDAEAISLAVVERAAGGSPPAALEALREIDASVLVNAIEGFQLPFIDGVTVPEHPTLSTERDRLHRVPVLTGANSYDGGLVYPIANMSEERLLSLVDNPSTDALALYSDDLSQDRERALSRLFGDRRYLFSSAYLASEAGPHQPVYLYYIDYVPPELRDEWPGAPHLSELALIEGQPYLFTSFTAPANEVGPAMRAYWSNFIHTGDPNGHGLPEWRPAAYGASPWMVFGDTAELVETVAPDKLDAFRAAFDGR